MKHIDSLAVHKLYFSVCYTYLYVFYIVQILTSAEGNIEKQCQEVVQRCKRAKGLTVTIAQLRGIIFIFQCWLRLSVIICFVISWKKCNEFVSSTMMQQHRIRIDLPNTVVGPKNWHKCMVSSGLHRVSQEHGSRDAMPGTWCCTDETGQHCIFLHITWHSLIVILQFATAFCQLHTINRHRSIPPYLCNSSASFCASIIDACRLSVSTRRQRDANISNIAYHKLESVIGCVISDWNTTSQWSAVPHYLSTWF